MTLVTKTLMIAGFTLAAAGAQAATITASKNTTERAQITCSDCVGYVAATETGADAAQTENALPSTKGVEADFVNRMTGTTSFDARDANKVVVGGAETLSFETDFKYIVFKIGNQRFLIENNTPGSTFAFNAAAGTSSGLAHYTGFGTIGSASQVSAVPLPAAGVLLGSVLLGGGLVLRRRRKNAA